MLPATLMDFKPNHKVCTSNLYMLGIFACFLLSVDFRKIYFWREKSYSDTIKMTVWIQIRPIVFNIRPDLGLNCLQRLSEDDTGRESYLFHIHQPSHKNDQSVNPYFFTPFLAAFSCH